MITNYEEVWKDIEGFEGLYQVSSRGRIKSLPRIRTAPKGGEYIRNEVILKPFENKGYLYVLLHKEGKNYSRKVHRLVAQAFISNPDELPSINHLDYDRHNNTVENLEWITNEDNLAYSNCNRAKQHNCKTKSGERYITMRRGRYRVCITKHKVDKQFDSLEEAKLYRNERLKEYDYKLF